MHHKHQYHSSEKFQLESGQHLDNLQLTYHTYGQLNEGKDNVIWVFHALTANSDVMEWWPGLFGDNNLYTPKDFFIICVNTLGSPYGSSCPKSLDFPAFTVRDVVNAQLQLAASLNITQIHTAIGGSFGGYQALEFAYAFPGKIDHLILIATNAKESAWGIAIHEAQRLALESDPTFGQAEGGLAGMKAARGIAMLNYRTAGSFIEQQSDHTEKTDNFRAASYIRYQGDKFVKRFDAACYYYLTKCLDSHNVGRHRGGQQQALRRIKMPTLVIGISSDALVQSRFQKELAAQLHNGTYREIKSDFGHDGFLVEVDKIAEKIIAFYGGNQRRLVDPELTKTVI
jgi:homoserine O-acetyltransferase